MKKAYVKPALEVAEFDVENVITTSGVIGQLDNADAVTSSPWRDDWNQ